jgi:hypothetical protein
LKFENLFLFLSSLLSPFSFPAQLRSSPLSFNRARSACFRVRPTAAQQAGSPRAPPPAADVWGPHVSFYLSPPPRLRLADEPESGRRTSWCLGPRASASSAAYLGCRLAWWLAREPYPSSPAALNPSSSSAAAPVPPSRRRLAAVQSPWCCSVEPPRGKEPSSAVCLDVRAPRRRLVFAGAPPSPLSAVRRRAPPRVVVTASGCPCWVRACVLDVPVKIPLLRVHPRVVPCLRRRSSALRRRSSRRRRPRPVAARLRKIGAAGFPIYGPERAKPPVKANHTGQPWHPSRIKP